MKIPDAALHQHIAVLGKTGSGKTFAVKGVVEHWLEEGRRVGIVDPTGAWWGLRSSRDGKGAGYPILVLGGDHGDLPLPALGGAAVARLLAEQNVNLIADTSLLTVGERTRWFTDFGGALIRLNRAPLHLVLDEAHNFAPQGSGSVQDPQVGKMLHAANTLASGGRSRGIRLAMITQRPQKLHKDTLTSADTLIAMRVLAPQDRKAVEEWVKGCADPVKGKEVLDSLAGLARGEGWVWHPEGGFLQRLRFPAIKTFDSSATPTDGGILATPKGMAEIDLTEIKAAMADAVKEAEANDPKLLRAEIARLKREAEKKPVAERVEVPVVDHEAVAQAEERGYARGRRDAFGEVAEKVQALAGEAVRMNPRPAPRAQAAPARPKPAPRAAPAAHESNGLDRAARAFMTALAQQGRSLTRNQVAIFAGYSATSRHVDNTLAGLRSRGYAVGSRDAIEITAEGLSALGSYDPLPTGSGLRDYWMRDLDKAASEFLRVLCEAYPETLTRDEIAERAGYSPTSRHVDNTLAQLRSRELASGGRAAIKASDDLFD